MMQSREAKILVALLSVLVVLVVYRTATKEEPKRVRELTYKPGGKEREERGREPVVKTTVQVQKAGLQIAEKKAYSGVIRNPFKPLYPPPPPVAPPKIVLPPPVPFPVITTRGPSPAKIESGKFKFLGLLDREGERKIFLSREKEVFIVKKGDTVGMFQIGEMADNWAILIAKDTKEEFKLIIEDVKSTKPGILPGGGRR